MKKKNTARGSNLESVSVFRKGDVVKKEQSYENMLTRFIWILILTCAVSRHIGGSRPHIILMVADDLVSELFAFYTVNYISLDKYFLTHIFSICFEHPQRMFWLRNKKIIFLVYILTKCLVKCSVTYVTYACSNPHVT